MISKLEPRTERIANTAIRAEQTLLGAILQDGRKFEEVADQLTPGDFVDDRHKSIYLAMLALLRAANPIDLSTVDEQLHRDGCKLDLYVYLATLMKNSTGGANAGHYARTVQNASLERALIRAGNEIVEIGGNPAGSVQEKLLRANSLISDVTEVRITKEPKTLKELVYSSVVAIDDRFNRDGVIIGLSTGFKDLDGITAGLQGSDLIIIAGRPSMGKTAFAMNIAENVVLSGKPVLVFSMEMSAQQLVDRAIASVGKINYQNIRTGKLTDDEWPKLTSASLRLEQAPLMIDDSPGLSSVELRLRARRAHRKNALSLIVIDYIQLMRGDGGSRYEIITQISNDLKALAKELNVPVIALSQLNRSVDGRADKRPIMSDLRESGAIEQDADVIVFMYRDEYYNKESIYKGMAEAIIAKQRSGSTGDVFLNFYGNQVRFSDFDGVIPKETTRPSKASKGFEY